jgi:replicative DNA helicase
MFISAVIAEGSVAALLQKGPVDHLFKASEMDVYQFVRAFVKDHQALPTPDTIEAHTGDALVKHSEPSSYYFELLELRHIELTLKQGMKVASDLLLPENKDPQQALKAITEAAMSLVARKHPKQVIDFRDAYDMIIADYASKWNAADSAGLQFGWPSLDEMSGGMVRGDMTSFVGRPQQGKTWQMLYGAHHGWKKAGMMADPDHGQSRMFVSMEMSVLPVSQRLAAMQVPVAASHLKHGMSTLEVKKLKAGLNMIKGYAAPFYIVDGNLAATVEDIWALARQLKPDAIFIDGAYLVKHPKERDRYRRVAENAELMKSELAALAPTVCSWQFAKSAAKKNKKQGEKPDLEDIGYTDAIAQVSSLVLGLFEDDSNETLAQRRVEILKGRSGETGSFTTRWDFQTMRFDEILPENVENLQFV